MLLLILMASNTNIFGATAETKWSSMLTNVYNHLAVLIATIVFVLVIIYMVNVVMSILNAQSKELAKLKGLYVEDLQSYDTPTSFWNRFYKASTNVVPIEQEHTIDLGHNYDGIRELDNNLPPWWLYMFYACIAFSFVYIYYFHWSELGNDQKTEYAMEVEKGNAEKVAYLIRKGESVDESSVVSLTKPEDIAAGKITFKTYCAACHTESGAGSVGPNLTDEYWLHGGGVKNIFKTIKYGVPEKGMIAWKDQLRPSEIQKIASFILSLKGTKPAGAKAPQGEIYMDSTIVKQ
jgi:cytochrome c oxidase cbb3-type subunit III